VTALNTSQAAVSADGTVSALLLEKNPSEETLNNRSGTLLLFTNDSVRLISFPRDFTEAKVLVESTNLINESKHSDWPSHHAPRRLSVDRVLFLISLGRAWPEKHQRTHTTQNWTGIKWTGNVSSQPTPVFIHELDGLGPTDPQSVTISAAGNGAGGSVYTVGALIGVHMVIVDLDARSGTGKIVRSMGIVFVVLLCLVVLC
jgi:hypothetical protein